MVIGDQSAGRANALLAIPPDVPAARVGELDLEAVPRAVAAESEASAHVSAP
jgi:hypothetical protein